MLEQPLAEVAMQERSAMPIVEERALSPGDRQCQPAGMHRMEAIWRGIKRRDLMRVHPGRLALAFRSGY